MEKLKIKKADLYILILGIFSWIFWAFMHPERMVYQEQLQMFLFDYEYFVNRVTVPGGVARYLSEFLVQFYNNVLLGALVIASLYMILQKMLLLLILKNSTLTPVAYIISFVPVLSLWCYMGNENVKLAYVIAVLFALLAMMLYPRDKSVACKLIALVAVTLVLYFISGPMVLMFGLYVALVEITHTRKLILVALSLLLPVACIIISASFVGYPLYRFFYGIGYNLLINETPTMGYIVMLLFVVVSALSSCLPVLKSAKAEKVLSCICLALVCAMFIFSVPMCYNSSKSDVLYYDYLVRTQKWNDVIAKAESKTPKSPLTVSSLNLALAMKGQLNDRAFQFFQNGWLGAFPLFNKNYETSLMTSEIYYHVGLVNTAQRFAFEAMETIPDGNKSARIVKRLAETNLINGEYDVARKYLNMLKKTLFYKKWAEKTEVLLGNEKEINGHPEYGYFRKVRLAEDFMFSEGEIDKIMGKLVMHNKSNSLAIQYLLFLPQLEGNQQKYMMYKDFVYKTLSGNSK